MRLAILSLCVLVFSAFSYAADGDTIHITTVDFGGASSGKFLFPPSSVKYQKVLINYTMKCPCAQYDYTMNVSVDEYRTNPDTVINWEIFRFITPYGQPSPVGADGFTWTQDITDFSPLLHDSVKINAGSSVQVQVSFDIITGTPPRDVIHLDRLWAGDPSYGYDPPIDSFFAAMRVPIVADAKGARLKLIQTGHGEDNNKDAQGNQKPCAEFCDNEHFVYVNDTLRSSSHVWRPTCGLNPLSPQNGTWVTDRANWCPGASVDPIEHELTPYMKAGSPMKIHVGMTPYTYQAGANFGGNERPHYTTSVFLIQYGAPHFTNDASVEWIKAPTKTQMFNRQNPICSGPSVVIRNGAAADLKSLHFEYGVKGGGRATYDWTGMLKFLDTLEVELPPFDWGTWTGPNVFEVTVSNPNGATDEYAPNNTARSTFDVPPTLYPEVEIHLLTNKYASEQYEWWLTNSEGAQIAHASNLADNTTYVDTFHLADGCYQFRLWNYAGIGLDWPYASAQVGSGRLWFTTRGATLKNFSGDFGSQVFWQFRVGPKPTAVASIDSLKYGNVKVGASRELSMQVWPVTSAGLVVSDAKMVLARSQFVLTGTSPSLASGPVTLKPGDTMTFTVAFTPTSEGSKWARLSITTNDERNNTVGAAVVGTAIPANGVDELAPLATDLLHIEAVPNVVSSETEITFGALRGADGRATVEVVNALGQTVSPVYDGVVSGRPTTVTWSAAGLPSGPYFVIVRSALGVASAPLTIVR